MAQVYRGSPPYLPCDSSGTALLAPSQCTQPIGLDHVFDAAHTAAVPPHLRLLSASPPDSFSSLHALPAALCVNVVFLSSHCLQDLTVRALTMGQPGGDAVSELLDEAHDKVSCYLLVSLSLPLSLYNERVTL